MAGQDARVKAIAVQIPGIGGNPDGAQPTKYSAQMLQDAIKRYHAKVLTAAEVMDELIKGT